jgi:pimeloyl-ACP methyl ester carboxylesterase
MTHRFFFQCCTAVVASLCISVAALAQPCAELPPGRTVSDQKGGCLALVPIGSTAPSSKTLIVMLHGDGGGQLSQSQITRWTRLGETLKAPDRNVFFMLRPGYQSPAGNSSGWANPRDDDYTAQNMERVAGALRTLQESYKSEKLILVGHSGGAATSSIVLGKHPGIADAALLLGCPCDVPPWRDHRNAQRGATGGWPRSLNPLAFVAGIPAGTPVLAVTGTQDENTLPTFARRWVDAANEKSAKARFVEIPGLSHSTILQWPDIASSVSELIEATKR